MKLYKGDCVELMKYIPDNSIDMVLCDLPYGLTQNKWDSSIPLHSLWMAYSSVVKKNGVIVLFGNQPFTSFVIVSNIDDFKYSWVWEKSTKTNFLNAKKQPLRKHEDILVFSKGRSIYNPQGVTDKNTITKQGKKETTNYGKQDRSAGGYMQEKTGYPHDILYFKSNPSRHSLHPTQKPVDLCEYLIKTYTNEGDTVLDNCAGSFTTGVACMNTNRRFIGIEKDDKYFEIGCKRLEKWL